MSEDKQAKLTWIRKNVEYWQNEVNERPGNRYAAEELARYKTMLAVADAKLAADQRQRKLFDVR